MNCDKYDYKVDEEVKHQIRALITAKKLENLQNFANAREVRNLFEEIITNQARRVSKLENPSNEDMMTIILDDLLDDDERYRFDLLISGKSFVAFITHTPASD